ncbi:hypothetical protein ABMA58_12810, partial [Oceanospirillum sp. HFRX-1_2]
LFETESLDTVVLGCTHFPLLLDELEQIQPRPIRWVDSGAAIARRVALLLSQDGVKISGTSPQTDNNIVFLTRYVSPDSALMRSFKRSGFDQLRIIRP